MILKQVTVDDEEYRGDWYSPVTIIVEEDGSLLIWQTRHKLGYNIKLTPEQARKLGKLLVDGFDETHD